MMSISIGPATLRDATYVAGNMRQSDREEVFCQMPEGTSDMAVGYMLLMYSEAYAARWTDKQGREWPCLLFGVQPMNVAALLVWAIGTRHAWRAIPAVTRFFVTELLPRKMEQGYLTMEARSIEGHTTAHDWMRRTGAKIIGDAFPFGRHGELFHLFRWTVDDYEDMGYRDTSNDRKSE